MTSHTPLSRFIAIALLLTGVGALSGCGVTETSTPINAVADNVLTGRIVGGQQAVQGASIYLYAAGTTGNGTGAINLLKNP